MFFNLYYMRRPFNENLHLSMLLEISSWALWAPQARASKRQAIKTSPSDEDRPRVDGALSCQHN